MEGPVTLNYKGKSIVRVNYSQFAGLPRAEQKEKILALLREGDETLKRYPPNTLLSLVNLSNVYFDMDIVNAFKNSNNAAAQNSLKKMAVVGITGVVKAAYNFVVGLSPNSKIRTFATEEEAKEWLASD